MSRTRGVSGAPAVGVITQRVDHLTDEERVALGGGAHLRGKHRATAGIHEDLRDIRLGERRELDARDIGTARQTGHDVDEQPRAAGLGVAVRGQHQQPHVGIGPQQVAQEQQGQLVGPVNVV
jgi:hypothetical protein